MNMKMTTVQIYDQAKYGILHDFLWNYAGLITDEELEKGLWNLYKVAIDSMSYPNEFSEEEKSALKRDLDILFQMDKFGENIIKLLRPFYESNTSQLTVDAVVHYFCSGELRDRDKAKALFLKAYEEGDYYAECFAKKKGWIE